MALRPALSCDAACSACAVQDIAQAFLQGADDDDHHADDRSSTTWYESAGAGGSASARSSHHGMSSPARADSLDGQPADEAGFASPRSTGSYASATGSFHSQTSFKTIHSHTSAGSFTSAAAAASTSSSQLASAAAVGGASAAVSGQASAGTSRLAAAE